MASSLPGGRGHLAPQLGRNILGHRKGTRGFELRCGRGGNGRRSGASFCTDPMTQHARLRADGAHRQLSVVTSAAPAAPGVTVQSARSVSPSEGVLRGRHARRLSRASRSGVPPTRERSFWARHSNGSRAARCLLLQAIPVVATARSLEDRADWDEAAVAVDAP